MKTPSETKADEDIWRYMDLPKFISLLRTDALWFARVDTFEDKWEGISRHIPFPSSKEGHPAYLNFVKTHCRWRKSLNKRVFINCWTLEQESIPMWKNYASFDSGIAVQSTVGRVTHSVKMSGFNLQEGGLVEYYDALSEADFDYSSAINFSWPKAFELHLRKRSCFSFEREWRALIIGNEKNRKKGIEVPVVVNDLIERVLVSPLATASFLKTVTVVSEKFGLNVSPKKSQLARSRPPESSTVGQSAQSD